MGKLKATVTDRAAPMTATVPAVIVFGRDDKGKAHGSWFSADAAELAEKAAAYMNMKVLRVETDEHRAAALQLAAGRIFESGRGFVPFCKEAAHEGLCAFEGAFEPPPPVEPEQAATLVATSTPQRWEDIVVGSLVLASARLDEGWFEAVVAEARGDALFVLKWQGWPEHDAFVRRADGLALLPPGLYPDVETGEASVA